MTKPADSDLPAERNFAQELYRKATDVAGLCKEMAEATAVEISGRKYVVVEAWMAIATAHGCCASVRSVEKIPGGYRATAELKRMSDGAVLSTAEGFVGEDEVIWFGGIGEKWSISLRKYVPHTYPKREEYAIRAMAQTRGVSRVCRTVFAHVVVMMNKNLETTPAEEVTPGPEVIDIKTTPVPGAAPVSAAPGGTTAPAAGTPGAKETLPGDPPDAPPGAKKVEVTRDPNNIAPEEVAAFKEGKWRQVVIHFGKNKGKKLGEEGVNVQWYAEEWYPKPFGAATTISGDDRRMRAALDAYCEEEKLRDKPRHDRTR